MTNSTASANRSEQQRIDEIESNYLEICRELNMDNETEKAAWTSYSEASQNCTLQGEASHWLCCAVYAACRDSYTPTVGNSNAVVTGNCVSLTKLLRTCNISINEFCTKIKVWARLRNLSKGLRAQIERLEQSFHVSLLLYQKYEEIFPKLFVISSTERKKKKAKPGRCQASKLYDFCWCLFISAKGEEPNHRTDLVTSFHLLLCCIDLIFINAVLEDRRDLINPEFPGLPKNWNSDDFDATALKDFCAIRELCDLAAAEYVEVVNIKSSSWKNVIKKFIKHKTLYCNSFTEIISNTCFEPNLKSLNNTYEQYVLSVGEFDERIFLNSDKDRPLQLNTHMRGIPSTPVSTMAAVKHLENIAEKEIPKDFIEQIGDALLQKLENRLNTMRKIFLEKCPSNERISAEDIFKYARALYFNFLGKIIPNEMKMKPHLDCRVMLEYDILQETLIVCCIEIVNVIHDAKLAFPWVLDCFDLNAYHFYKIIEIVVQNHDNVLTRLIINHLNTIEGMCLDHLIWRKNSMLWTAMKNDKTFQIPSWEHVDHRNANTSSRKKEESGLGRNFFQSPSPGYNSYHQSAGAESARRDLFNAGTSTNNVRDAANKVAEANSPKPRAGSLFLFFRKFYELAYGRITKLCDGLELRNDTYLSQIWTIFEHSIIQKTEIMQDRHLDQIIMCTIYVFIKVKDIPNKNFTGIMTLCRQELKATSTIYRQVLLKSAEETEDGQAQYGDIIQFYNSVYVQNMSPFALNFADNTKKQPNLFLSPHPPERVASPRPISSACRVYVQPLDKKEIPSSPDYKFITFEINKSPAKDLLRINERMNRREDNPSVVAKRQKRGCVDTVTNKLKGIMKDRTEGV